MADFKNIKLENQGTVWRLTLDRPAALNALNSELLNELFEAIGMIAKMDYDKARALILTGSGEKSFVAGADIKEISELGEAQALAFAKKGQSIFSALSELKIPVIAAVNGFALGGGCELALACDFIVASENAKFGLPEVTLGLIPGFGGCVRLSRAVGLRKAKELTFTGDMLSAQEALELGLANKVVPLAELMNTVQAMVEKMILRAPIALAHAKKTIGRTWDLDIEDAQKMEAEQFAGLFHTQDVREGTKAFIEKRKPGFVGR